jgi:hypothetical protein
MNTTIDTQSRVVSNGEMQAANELCARLESRGLLENIEGGSENRHRAWLLTAKGIEAMSFEMCNNLGEQLENAR